MESFMVFVESLKRSTQANFFVQSHPVLPYIAKFCSKHFSFISYFEISECHFFKNSFKNYNGQLNRKQRRVTKNESFKCK